MAGGGQILVQIKGEACPPLHEACYMVKPLQDKVSTPGKQHLEGPPGAALPVSTHKINREGHAAHFPAMLQRTVVGGPNRLFHCDNSFLSQALAFLTVSVYNNIRYETSESFSC